MKRYILIVAAISITTMSCQPQPPPPKEDNVFVISNLDSHVNLVSDDTIINLGCINSPIEMWDKILQTIPDSFECGGSLHVTDSCPSHHQIY